MIQDFLFLPRVKRQLVDGRLPSSRAFVYFFIITAVDNVQLAILQVSPAEPTRWTPLAVWGSLVIGGAFRRNEVKRQRSMRPAVQQRLAAVESPVWVFRSAVASGTLR